jgi:general secretion pathway protein G
MVQRKLASESGLTLVEIVVVLIILGVIFTIVAPKVLSQGDKAKARATLLQLQKMRSHIEQFQLQYNSMPNSLEDLTGCTDKTGSSCIPLADEDEMNDAWGNRFRYEGQGNRYMVKSLGSDGREGGSGVEGDLVLEGP